ncbi:MAG: hypothetical protein FD169_1696 [Bacillota bacterium]|nr:MAG: hypothetical protein FD169_1696 [Bacillota bacterium]MBS3950628.1 hypothetical protein [Peptococcaceae bacterium]
MLKCFVCPKIYDPPRYKCDCGGFGEVLSALAKLTAQGVFVEPTSGVGAAGFIKAIATGAITSGEQVVVELTGKKKD